MTRRSYELSKAVLMRAVEAWNTVRLTTRGRIIREYEVTKPHGRFRLQKPPDTPSSPGRNPVRDKHL